jgi:hypothetical protein
MATDAKGKAGFTAGAIAKELGASPAQVKKALEALKLKPDFVKGPCGYFYPERIAQVKKALK